MSLPQQFSRLRLPVIGAPLFIISNPQLVIAQCKAGIVGSFPALNARPQSQLDEWIHRIEEELAAGELAALGTAVFWSATATFFTLAGRRVGSVGSSGSPTSICRR